MKNKIGFIGIGQGGGNIAQLLDKSGYKTFVINTSKEDLDTLNIKEKHLIPNSEGCNHNRSKAIEYTKKHYKELLEKILNIFIRHEIIYLVFSSGGGTGSGIGVILAELMAKKMKNKTIGVVCILPSNKEMPKIQVNAYQCFTELSQIKELGGVFILDNNKDDKLSINKRFVELFNDLVNINRHISVKGNIDNAEIKELLRVRGCIVVSKTDSIGKIVRSLDNSIFPEIEKDKNIVYLAMSLIDEVNIEDITKELGIPYDMYINYNNNGQNIIVASGLSFFSSRLDSIKEIINQNKSIVDTSIKNALGNTLENGLDWEINLCNKQELDTEIDFEEIFKKY